MLKPLMLFVHLSATIFWIGGMALMHLVVRPCATELLDPPLRLSFMALTLTRFFSWVSAAVLLILLSGATMLSTYTGTALPLPIQIMSGIGLIMMLIFGHIRFALHPRLKRATSAADWPAAAKHLAAIRQRVAINLVLGILVIGAVTLGR
jgi:uncharacterized membrane protein